MTDGTSHASDRRWEGATSAPTILFGEEPSGKGIPETMAISRRQIVSHAADRRWDGATGPPEILFSEDTSGNAIPLTCTDHRR